MEGPLKILAAIGVPRRGVHGRSRMGIGTAPVSMSLMFMGVR